MSRHLILALLLTPSLAAAQTRRDMIDDWQRLRDNVIAYVDAMPDSAMDFRPTPGVRSFAQQVEHAVTTNLEVAAIGLRGARTVPFAPDTAAIFHHRAALHDYVDHAFAYVLDAVRSSTPSQLLRETPMYGNPAKAGGRLLGLAYEHAVWTLGQTIPYLRLNGVTPPPYKDPL